VPHGQNDKKIHFAFQGMRRLRLAFQLAQEVEESLGKCQILLGTLQTKMT
jgi:hypothetical protein